MSLKDPCPQNDTEDNIVEQSGNLKNEDLTTTRQRITFYGHESQGPHNHTGYFYPGLENWGKSSLAVSPVMVASVVIGMVTAISCVTIILGSLRKERRSWLQPRRPSGDHEDGQDSEGETYWSSGIHDTCNLVGYWTMPFDLSSDPEAEAIRLHWLCRNPPPRYEECMGPGATQLYLPMDAPPPYSLINTDHSSRGCQQVESGLHTNSMDALPPYEAVCWPSPPPSLLPLPGPEPEPRSFQGSPTPNGSPERIV
ncbi:PREDICTED: protein BEAN1 [Miniopterus natalensis]|uniref:protein BEAN1 n=1 Tax=Miniopterus natalensis TaxID=291302 RepID=UPI0007A6F214|nr:PREDICTED: protein BEAN1 [Miniopterus natalensis]